MRKKQTIKKMLTAMLACAIAVAGVSVSGTSAQAEEQTTVEKVIFADDFNNLTDATGLKTNGWTNHSGPTSAGGGNATNSRVNIATRDTGDKCLTLTNNNTYSASARIQKDVDVAELKTLTVEFEFKTTGSALKFGICEDMTNRYADVSTMFYQTEATADWTYGKVEFDFTNATYNVYVLNEGSWSLDSNYVNQTFTLEEDKIMHLSFLNPSSSQKPASIDNVKMYTTYEAECLDESLFTADFEETSDVAALLKEGWTAYAQGSAQFAVNYPVELDNKKVLMLSSSNYSCSARIMKSIDVGSLSNLTVRFDVKTTGRSLQVGIDNDNNMSDRHITLDQKFWESAATTDGWVTAKISFTMNDSDIKATAYTLQNDEWVQDTTYTNVAVTAADQVINLCFLSTYISNGVGTYIDNVDISVTHRYSDGICTDCGKVQAVLMGHSLTLDGTIGVNFHMKMPAQDSYYEAMEMRFAWADETRTVSYADAGTDAVGYKVFTCHVPAKEMTDTVTAALYDGSTEVCSSRYSVKEYADVILTNTEDYEKEIPLVQAMLNYGSCAQEYFNYNAENPANGGTYLGSTSLDSVTASTLEAYRTRTALGNESVKLYGASLVLESTTTLRLYFTGDSAASVTCNGEALTAKGGYYYVDVANILPQDLLKDYTINLANGDEAVNVTYNCMTYGYNVLNSDRIGSELKNVVRALYLYGDAATTYIGGR